MLSALLTLYFLKTLMFFFSFFPKLANQNKVSFLGRKGWGGGLKDAGSTMVCFTERMKVNNSVFEQNHAELL